MVAGMAVEMAVGMVELVTFAGMVALYACVYTRDSVYSSVIQAMWACWPSNFNELDDICIIPVYWLTKPIQNTATHTGAVVVGLQIRQVFAMRGGDEWGRIWGVMRRRVAGGLSWRGRGEEGGVEQWRDSHITTTSSGHERLWCQEAKDWQIQPRRKMVQNEWARR